MTINDRLIKRLSVVLLLSGLLLPLAGCKKELPVPEDTGRSGYTIEQEGTTYMSLSLRATSAATTSDLPEVDKSAGNYTATWQGDDVIENFAIYIVSEGDNTVQCISGRPDDTNIVRRWDPEKQELLLTPFKTKPLSKKIFAFFNIPEQYRRYLEEKKTDKRAFLERIAEPIPYMGEPGITYDGDAPRLEAFRPDSHIATKKIATDTIPNLESFSDKGRSGYPESKVPRRYLDFPNAFFDTERMSSIKPGPLPFIKRKDRILSSGVRDNYLPEDYVTADEVMSDERNVVKIYTRRALAQAVVTAEAALVNEPIHELEGMVIKGVSFQVFNFEPTFFPIAKTEKEGDLPGNRNTRTPLYDQTNNSSLINFSTYRPTLWDETFSMDALVRDRFFRSAHFVYGEGPAELDPSDKDYAQKILREIEYSDKREIDGTLPVDERSRPIPLTHTTTFWGSCYVTESTHAWAEDGSSGYNTSNTPFFAVIASFDMRSLPWASKSEGIVAEKNNNKQADFEKLVKDLNDQLQKAKDDLAAIPEAGGGGMSEAEADAVFEAYVQWWKDHLRNPNGAKRFFNSISKQRDAFVKTKALDEAGYLNKIKRDRSTLRTQDFKGGLELPDKGYRNKKYPENKRVGSPTELDATDLDVEQKEFKKTLEADRKLRAGDPNADKRAQLSNLIKDLEKQIEKEKKEFFRSDGWYPSESNSRELFTPSMYEQGITRVYYSQVNKKFYLNYHEIPVDKRDGNATHTLSANDSWVRELKAKLPNGKDFPTHANGVSLTNAVLAPDTPGLMEKLSKLLNGQLKETDLSIAERHSMDFYLYGRIAPGLKEYFYGANFNRTDPVDIHSGYVEWYTAQKKDKVVSYPCYIRNRVEDRNSIRGARLMMVYYAWLNPNTKSADTWCASPVLRNNIYHMHIAGFTKMGLSAIPFVPREDKLFHTPFDPDEEVPLEGMPLNSATATGSARNASLMGTGSSSFRMTF